MVAVTSSKNPEGEELCVMCKVTDEKNDCFAVYKMAVLC